MSKYKEIVITQDDIENKTKELCNLIKKFKGSHSVAAEFICFNVIVQAAYDLYEGLGILDQVKYSFRGSYLEIMNEKEEQIKDTKLSESDVKKC